jgi:hypothetical protein
MAKYREQTHHKNPFNRVPTNQSVCAGAAANTRWRWRNDDNPGTPCALKAVTDEAPLIPGVFCGQ